VFVCICVIMFEMLLVPSIAATALVFDSVDFNDITIWKGSFRQTLGIGITFYSISG
jgi:hypothetical protein